jgi:hypothetical protein
MATVIIPKKSSVAEKIPLTSDLQVGEVAINLADKLIYTKNSANEVIVVGGGVWANGDVGFEVKNQTGSTIPKGTLVGFVGTVGSSGRLLVAPYLANGSQPSEYAVGLTRETIANGADGIVIDHGKISGLNTSAWAAGTILYASASSAGQLTSTRPAAPNNKIVVAAVVNSSVNAGTLEVRMTLGSSLSNDELVELTNLQQGQSLSYNATTGRFENSAAGSGSVTSVAATAGTGISITGSPITTTGTLVITNTAPNVTTNLTTTHNAANVVVNSSDGTNATINGATTSLAGVMTATDKTKLDGIAAGAQVNVATNLGYTTAASTGTVTSSTGTNATLPAATTSLAGLLTSTDKTKLDGIAAGAQVNTVTSVAGKTGAVTLVKGDVGLGDVDNTADSAKSVLEATRLNPGRTIALSGAATGTATSFNGSVNITIPVTGLNASNLNSGTIPDAVLSGNYNGITAIGMGDDFDTGPIVSFGAITGGSGYVDGTYTNVALTGGSGSLAAANITVVGGVVTTVVLSREGARYKTSDNVSAAAASLGGTGSGFSVVVSSVRRVSLNIYGSLDPRLRLMNSNTAVALGTELGSVLFGCNDATTGGRGDKVRLIGVAEGTSGGGKLEVWTAVNGAEPSLCATFAGNNSLTVTGDVNTTSDERLKTNWQALPEDFLDNLSKVKYGVYDRIDNGITQAGVSAQALQKVLPEVVQEDSEGMLSVNYGNSALVAVIELTKLVKELEEKIKVLETKANSQ